eukprot:jgi/Psemu1/40637/gm1.40637_g
MAPTFRHKDHHYRRRNCAGMKRPEVGLCVWNLLLLMSCCTMLDYNNNYRFVVFAWVVPVPVPLVGATGHRGATAWKEGRSLSAPYHLTRCSSPNSLKTSATEKEDASNDSTTASTYLYGVATQLMDLVLEQRTQDLETSPFEAWNRRRRHRKKPSPRSRSERIESLIETLTRPTLGESDRSDGSYPRQGLGLELDRWFAKASNRDSFYDPTESLFGNFYCTLYFYYPNQQNDDNEPPEDPIWEKTSLLPSNIKGQQYYIRNDFQQSVINYSEILGPDFTISAHGDLTPKPSPSLFPNKDSQSQRRLPDTFRVDATQISVSIFGGALSWKFHIQGSADLVVLYADPRLRIFASPFPSKTRVGNWEEAGLVVVQVRSDLVPTKNKRTPKIFDSR